MCIWSANRMEGRDKFFGFLDFWAPWLAFKIMTDFPSCRNNSGTYHSKLKSPRFLTLTKWFPIVGTWHIYRGAFWTPKKNGTKAQALSNWNRDDFKGNLWRFDYAGIGQSDGEISISNWIRNARDVLTHVHAEGGKKVDVVASSMGAFVSLNLYLQCPQMIRSMFLCAPAKVGTTNLRRNCSTGYVIYS